MGDYYQLDANNITAAVTDNQIPPNVLISSICCSECLELQFNKVGTCHEITLGKSLWLLSSIMSLLLLRPSTCYGKKQWKTCIIIKKHINMKSIFAFTIKGYIKLTLNEFKTNYSSQLIDFSWNICDMRMLPFKPLGPTMLWDSTRLNSCLIERMTTAGNFIVAAVLISQLKRGGTCAQIT